MNLRMLTVDDSSVIRKIIRGAAEVLEFEILEAEDGLEALKVVEQYKGEIDLILLDWNMPGMDGLEVLKTLKSNEEYCRIPIMMVTTESKKENIIEAVKAGVSHYMIKPFAMEEIMKKMLECLGRGGL